MYTNELLLFEFRYFNLEMARLTWEQIPLVNPKGTLELGEGEESSWMGNMSIILLVKVPSPNKSGFQPQGACCRALSFGEEF